MPSRIGGPQPRPAPTLQQGTTTDGPQTGKRKRRQSEESRAVARLPLVWLVSILHQFEKLLVNSCIRRELGMKGRSHDLALAHEDWVAALSGENFHIFPSADYLGCADK